VRAGVIGLGSMARRIYLPLLAEDERVDLVGVVSRRSGVAEQLGARFAVPGRYGSVADLLRDPPDVVFVHTETERHAPVVEEALRAGVHVFVDKPLAASLDLSRALTAQAESVGRLLAVGFNRRFAPMQRLARDWVLASGPVQAMRLAKHRAAVHDQSARTAVFDDVIHLLDSCCWLLGDHVELADADVRADHAGRLVSVSCTGRTGQAVGQLLMHRGGGIESEVLDLFGAGRSSSVRALEQVRLDGDGPARSLGPGPWTPVAERRGFTALVDHVLGSLQDPDACSVAARRVLPAHQLAEELLR
jgi:virulence factor